MERSERSVDADLDSPVTDEWCRPFARSVRKFERLMLHSSVRHRWPNTVLIDGRCRIHHASATTRKAESAGSPPASPPTPPAARAASASRARVNSFSQARGLPLLLRHHFRCSHDFRCFPALLLLHDSSPRSRYFLTRRLFTTSAAMPPAEVAPAAIQAAVEVLGASCRDETSGATENEARFAYPQDHDVVQGLNFQLHETSPEKPIRLFVLFRVSKGHASRGRSHWVPAPHYARMTCEPRPLGRTSMGPLCVAPKSATCRSGDRSTCTNIPCHRRPRALDWR